MLVHRITVATALRLRGAPVLPLLQTPSAPPPLSPSSPRLPPLAARMMSLIPKAAQMSVLVAAFYATMSVSLSLLNKALLSSYKFECYFTLLATQLVLSLTFCIFTRDFLGNPFSVAPFKMETLQAAIPMGVAYIFNVTLGFVGLTLVNVPMFFCIRRLVPICILIYEWATMGKTAERPIIGSVLVIAAGTTLAGWETLSDGIVGYTVTFLNNIATAAAFVMQKQFSTSTKVSTFSVVYYNGLVALPITLVGIIVMGEVDVSARAGRACPAHACEAGRIVRVHRSGLSRHTHVRK